MTKKPTSIVVDDHKIFRESLAYMLTHQVGVEVIGQAGNGKEFTNLLEGVKPDIVLMDIEMPIMDGVEATRIALQKYPDIKILVLSMHDEDEFYNTMIDLGVKGFVLKESDSTEVQRAIDEVLAGRLFFSQDLLLRLLKKRKSQVNVELTPREKEILSLIAQGYSNQEVADKLFLSIRTVEKHRSELLVKTESKNSISLVVFAIKNGLVNI